ncbi:MAG: ion channel [Chitinophagales bacterium]
MRIPTKKYKIYSETSLLGLLILTIFVVPAFPQVFKPIVFNLLFSLIFLACGLSISRSRKSILYAAATLIIVLWISDLLDLLILNAVFKLLSVLFFVIIVIALITQTVKSKKVTATIIIGSVNGYLLLGLIFSLMVGIISYLQPDGYNFKFQAASTGRVMEFISEFTYYSFITLTTVGYGDFLPLSPLARALAILISTTGQLYLTILIALLIGKFLSSENGRI